MLAPFYFSSYFEVPVHVMEKYRILDICLISDLPLCVDSFLIRHINPTAYRCISKYLRFLSDRAGRQLSFDQLDEWFCFHDIKEDRLGRGVLRNRTPRLSRTFAKEVQRTLAMRRGQSRLEKIMLMSRSLVKDHMSSFTSNIIKPYLLEYTQYIACTYLKPHHRKKFHVERAYFDYTTEKWESATYELLAFHDTYVLLTPRDIVTYDKSWVNYEAFRSRFEQWLCTDKSQTYYTKQLEKGGDRYEAVRLTARKFPEYATAYLKNQDQKVDQILEYSANRREYVTEVMVDLVSATIAELETFYPDFYQPITDVQSAYIRAEIFGRYAEAHWHRSMPGLRTMQDAELFFKLVFYGMPLLSQMPTQINRINFCMVRLRSFGMMLNTHMNINDETCLLVLAAGFRQRRELRKALARLPNNHNIITINL
ncbi:MAG: hypothetical protein Q4A82_02655 [Corynebacterium sp.]|nr:hypothetical protein [Corynebacterium sp.]